MVRIQASGRASALQVRFELRDSDSMFAWELRRYGIEFWVNDACGFCEITDQSTRRADALPLALNGLKKLLLWLFAGPHKFQLLMGQAHFNNQAEPGEKLNGFEKLV